MRFKIGFEFGIILRSVERAFLIYKLSKSYFFVLKLPLRKTVFGKVFPFSFLKNRRSHFYPVSQRIRFFDCVSCVSG
ncbi:hypothetical protein CH367_05235 [Leptospira barantonii]|uniref:DUF1564 family protein n=1 Tax=Leptospira barantonii TaxID=2023184 RepID=A0ABX4NQ12_9LEPT|nr:hypothetical protein CH367_05235 [Leptospira barantonii]